MRLTYWDRVIGDRQIGFFASDSVGSAEHIRAELEAVLRHRSETIVAMTAWGWLADLNWPTAQLTVFKEEPVRHFYEGQTLVIASL